MRKILVIGGRGHLGQLVVDACRKIDDLEVTVGGRTASGKNAVVLDLGNPNTFDVIKDFEIVVDCADTSNVSPQACLSYCLETGKTFVETSAFPHVTEGLIRTFHSGRQLRGQGVGIIGAGLFPGLSNVAAAQLCKESCHSLELAIGISPFSGSGKGTARLMTDLLLSDAVYFEAGRQRQRKPFTTHTAFPFESGMVEAEIIGLAEATMLHQSLGVPNVKTYLAPRPAVLSLPLRLFGKMVPRNQAVRRFLRVTLGACITLIRTTLLKGRKTVIEISIVRNRASVDGDYGHTLLRFNDGIGATGTAIAAAISILLQRKLNPGVYLLDEMCSLKELRDEMIRLASPNLEISVRPIE